MANQKLVDLLKQGVYGWNQWRQEHPKSLPDLMGADLSNTNLVDANLNNANLRWTRLHHSKLNNVDFSHANLNHANLRRTTLSNANLNSTHLYNANFSDADLNSACLSNTDLRRANFSNADLSGVDLTNALIGWTQFGGVDLRTVKGLETLRHEGPSSIGIDTIYKSQGQIPVSLLRQAGVPQSFLEIVATITNRPIEYYTVFISYSGNDQLFAERLYADLQGKGVRCWFAPEHMEIGDKIRLRIEESIRLYDKLLLVISENSIASNWVAYEVERALNKEPEGVPNVLYPIRLDDAVMQYKAGWADGILRTRYIGDFTHWKNHDEYQKAFNRLLRDLRAESI